MAASATSALQTLANATAALLLANLTGDAPTSTVSPAPLSHQHTPATSHEPHLDQQHQQQQQQHTHDHQHHQVGQNEQPHLFQAILGDQVTQTKLLASLVLFIITLLCGYVPVRCILNQTYIQYAMFAGGGVLMATAFCHLIPETHDSYRLLMGTEHDNHHHHHHNQHHSNETAAAAANEHLAALNIPLPEVTLCCGFFFMYLVEQLMIRFINNHTHEHPCDTSMGQLVPSSNLQTNNGYPSSGASSAIGSSTANLDLAGNPVGATTKATEFYKFLRGLLIVSAFMAHSIFDGVAIGSQVTVEKVWTIYLAISCHKLIIAAVVGLELFAATLESHLWTLVHLSIFSIMSPIGIILVVVAQNSLHIDANHPAMIMLQSFATGTLLYIVFVEILQPKEGQAYEKNRIGKSISLIGGFALMLLVLTLIGEG